MVSDAYDRIADSYDEDWCGLYAESSRRAVAQIVAALADAVDLEVTDLAVGTGNTLDSLYRRLSQGTVTGFDVSTGMLGKAWDKLPRRAQLIHDSAANAEKYLGPASQDLRLCHFLLRYLEPQVVLPTAYRLLKHGGYFSLVTTTQRSLIETYTGRFAKTEPLLGVRRQLAKGGNPLDHAQGMEMLERCGFELVADNLYREVVTFRSFDDVRAWAFESGWAVEVVDGRMSVRIAFLRIAFPQAPGPLPEETCAKFPLPNGEGIRNRAKVFAGRGQQMFLFPSLTSPQLRSPLTEDGRVSGRRRFSACPSWLLSLPASYRW
jgi:ubiquinone/menaquinone biosynthesis C-methylase UbiE